MKVFLFMAHKAIEILTKEHHMSLLNALRLFFLYWKSSFKQCTSNGSTLTVKQELLILKSTEMRQRMETALALFYRTKSYL